MKLTLHGHDDLYAVEQLQMALFGNDAEGTAESRLYRGDTYCTASTTITHNGRTAHAVRRFKTQDESVRLRRQKLQQSYYAAAIQLLPKLPPWGALSGVRPTKITTKHLLEGGTPKSADSLLHNTYYVTKERRELALDCSASTVRAASLLDPSDVSLYVGIPFCPTRCIYCSFVSRTIGKRSDLIEPYLEALLKEIEVTGRLLANSGRKVRTIYIGGGTPTSLSTEQMTRLLDALRASFDLSDLLEFTIEGGRPDTLDLAKLTAIRHHGADRMSINPQTMEDGVLAACRRPHTGDDVLRSFHQAQEAGFDVINMDLIAGLPTDTFEGFCRSLDTTIGLNPANITVHTLALKKGADLFEERFGLPTAEMVAEMVDYANTALRNAGYKPYYLYRQKYMSGSFENVGWSRDGLDSLYNIYMMEEVHTILSLGGGGMNKVNLPDGRLERFHNPKFPEQYIEMIDEVCRQKEEMFRLMKQSC